MLEVQVMSIRVRGILGPLVLGSACGLLLVLAIVILIGREENLGHSRHGNSSESSVALSTPLETPRQVDRRPGEGSDAGIGAEQLQLRSVLAEYWGPQWPQVREAMEKEGIDLDAPFSLRPWREVEDAIRAQFVDMSDERKYAIVRTAMRWPEQLTVEWLRENFDVPDTFDGNQLQRVEDIGREYNSRLEVLAWEYADQLQYAWEDLWARDQFVRAPRTTAGAPSPYASRTFASKSIAHGSGWCVSGSLAVDDFPNLALLRQETHQLWTERNARIRTYLASR